MIDKTLAGLFKTITEEAAANPAFGKKLEDQLAKFGQELAERRLAEKKVADFHPFIEFKKGAPEDFEARLARFDVKELRILIDKHRLDPANTLKGKSAKKALVAHILAAAAKRADRDAKLFEY